MNKKVNKKVVHISRAQLINNPQSYLVEIIHKYECMEFKVKNINFKNGKLEQIIKDLKETTRQLEEIVNAKNKC